jgi:hypothetical protein
MQQRPKHSKLSRLFDSVGNGIYNDTRSHLIFVVRTYYIDMTSRQ